MFEDALLDSSLRHTSVLHRIHYLLSAFTGMLVFAVGMFVMPLLLPAATERALMTAASILDALATLYALMICYVWVDARQQHWWAWPWLGVALLLNLPGFLIYLVYYARKTGDWKRAAMPLAYVAESLLVGVLILVPLIYTQALPNQFLITEIHISPPPGRPPAPRPATPPRPMPHRPTLYPMVSPVSIPPTIARISEPPEPPKVGVSPGSYVPGVPVGLGGAGFVPGGASLNPETLPPPPPNATTKPQIIRLQSEIVAAKALFQPKPIYPQMAVTAHIQGTVVLQAIIGKDGAIQDLKLLSGHPILAQAALNAVKAWRYQPTLLNSEPVEVLTEINVIFTLGE